MIPDHVHVGEAWLTEIYDPPHGSRFYTPLVRTYYLNGNEQRILENRIDAAESLKKHREKEPT
jgi:hypothetical protein